MSRRILVVDDELFSRDLLRRILEAEGFEVETAVDGRSALGLAIDGGFPLLITDYKMPDMDGLSLLAAIRAAAIPMGVVILTGQGDYQMALDAMRAGADDVVTKPCEPERLCRIADRVIERRRLIDELATLRRQLREEDRCHQLISKNTKMRRVFDQIRRVAPINATVLVYGETGTGKELVARAIHDASDRRDGPFKAVNCAALSDALLESELFGHEKGAFTGADRLKKGRFELADGGTLFLDEIGDISPMMQAKLLRVLETGTFERVGGVVTHRVDVRIVAATNKDLHAEMKAGRFRADLYFRLNVMLMELPPLRERPEDIPLLTMHFLEKFAGHSTPAVTEIDHEAMQALLAHHWPGNVRELENTIKAAIAMADGHVIRRAALPARFSPAADPAQRDRTAMIDVERPLAELSEELIGRVERAYFARLLTLYRGNVARCAEHAGLSRRSVTQKLQKFGLDRLQFKKGAAAGDSSAVELP